MSATPYTKKLAADIVYNQYIFHGKKDYWFQPQCEKLGWDISDNLSQRCKSVLILVCIDLKLSKESTKHITVKAIGALTEE